MLAAVVPGVNLYRACDLGVEGCLRKADALCRVLNAVASFSGKGETRWTALRPERHEAARRSRRQAGQQRCFFRWCSPHETTGGGCQRTSRARFFFVLACGFLRAAAISANECDKERGARAGRRLVPVAYPRG